jgi:hypothetical protein
MSAISLDITVYCKDCGEILDAEISLRSDSVEIDVDPCRSCLKEIITEKIGMIEGKIKDSMEELDLDDD